MTTFDYFNYYFFLLQTIAIGLAIIILVAAPLLGVSMWDVLVNVFYRTWVPRSAVKSGDIVIGTRPVMPLGGWVGRPIMWTTSQRSGRLVLFAGKDADRMLRAVARRQYGPTVLVAEPSTERSRGRLWDLWTRRADVPARPPTEQTAELLRSLVAGNSPVRLYITDVATFVQRYPDLLPLVLEPPSFLSVNVSLESLSSVPAALRDRIVTAAMFFAIFRQAPEDLNLLLGYAPDRPLAGGKSIPERLRESGRAHPLCRLDLRRAHRLRRRRCLVVANGFFEGEVICWSARMQGIPLLL